MRPKLGRIRGECECHNYVMSSITHECLYIVMSPKVPLDSFVISCSSCTQPSGGPLQIPREPPRTGGSQQIRPHKSWVFCLCKNGSHSSTCCPTRYRQFSQEGDHTGFQNQSAPFISPCLCGLQQSVRFVVGISRRQI